MGLTLVQQTGAHDHRARRRTEVGRTGARFGPPGQWRASSEDEPEPPEAPDPDSPIGLTGARFGGAPRKRKPAPAPEHGGDDPAPSTHPAEPRPRGPEDPCAADDHSDWLTRPESHALVRPYAWTGGRTRARGDLAIEALVHTSGSGPRPSWEQRTITDLCLTPRSVAEVAALLAIPLGVARVLIGDLADAGVVEVRGVAGGAPDLATMHRVLAGLRRL